MRRMAANASGSVVPFASDSSIAAVSCPEAPDGYKACVAESSTSKSGSSAAS
jgi:hypothetical protein